MTDLDIVTFFVRAAGYGMILGLVLGILSSTKYLR